MTYIFLILIFAVLNRARGSQFWNLIPSTTFSRVLAALGMTTAAVVVSSNVYMFGLWPLLFAWMVPAWDPYWSAEIGDSTHGKTWGVLMMAARMTLAIPAILYAAHTAHGNYLWTFAAPLLATPYLILGSLRGRIAAIEDPIPCSEYTVGALFGYIMGMVCGI